MGTGLGTAISLGIDLVVVTVLYYWYKRSNRSADEIKNSQTLKIDETLEWTVRSAKDSCISYACVIGEVTPVGSTLRSRHVEVQHGVIQRIRLEEHKSEKLEGLWSDVKKLSRITSSPYPLPCSVCAVMRRQ